MKQYLDFLRYILDHGIQKSDRTGIGTISVFGYQMRFNLEQDFPLVTTKKIHFKSIVYELLWFLKGDPHIQYLTNHGVTIWNEWADENGDLGPVYGKQWRSWETKEGKTIDQITLLIESLRHNPDSRRHIVSAWNVGELDQMALPPCHMMFQFYVVNQQLSCQLYQRSADAFLGVPFNIASYALLTTMIAEQCNLKPKEFIWTGGDCHIYNNHFSQVNTQLSREPFPLPQLKLVHKPNSIFEYHYNDICLTHYEAHPSIKAEIAI